MSTHWTADGGATGSVEVWTADGWPVLGQPWTADGWIMDVYLDENAAKLGQRSEILLDADDSPNHLAAV